MGKQASLTPSLVCVPDLILLIGSLGNLVCNEEALEQYTIERCVLLPRVSSCSLCTTQCAQNRFFLVPNMQLMKFNVARILLFIEPSFIVSIFSTASL